MSILINNYEMHDTNRQKFYKASDLEVYQTVTANTFPMTMLTRFLGPELKARTHKKSAIITNSTYYS